MADKAFKIALLLVLLTISGLFVIKLSAGLIAAWRVGRFGLHQKGKSTPRIIREATSPIEFWFTMAFWHILLVGFVSLFGLGIYGIWRTLTRAVT
jgi:hypothetical protein